MSRRPERLAEVSRGDHAGCGSRLDHEHRPHGGRVGAEDPAARLHHEQLGPHARLREPALDPVQVALHDRPDHGVDHRRRRAQVLAELGGDLGRERDGHTGELLGEDLADAPLVLGVHVGVQQADGDRLDVLPSQDRGGVAHGRVVERSEHLALRAESLADHDRPVARHERLRLLELRVVEGRPHLARDLEQVAEPVGRHEAAPGDLPLDDRVRGDGRRVDDERHVAHGDATLREGTARGLHEPLRGVGGRRQHLRDRHLARPLVDEGRVGERPSDVDRQTNAHAAGLLSSVVAARSTPSRSMTTRYSSRARSRLTLPSRTSRRTFSGSRSPGGP